MRFWSGFFLLAGLACVVVAGVLGVLATSQEADISAYHHARACLAGVSANADCLKSVDGSVTAVSEFPGSGRVSADYAVDVRIPSRTLHITFTSDSPMLSYAVDGELAVVTMWHGVPVSVLADGRSEATTSVPDTSFASDLGNSEATGGFGVFFLLLGILSIRQNRRVGGVQPLTRPVLAGALFGLLLGSIVVAVSGIALGGKPDRLGPDLVATGAALAVILGLSVWLGISVTRRTRRQQTDRAGEMMAVDPHNLPRPVWTASQSPILPTAPRLRTAGAAGPLRARFHSVRRARPIGRLAAGWLTPTLTVAVLFGVFFTSQDGPAARAFRHAPACVGETNLTSCVGDFTAVVNGVRTPANGASFAGVSYVTPDAAINTWAQFDGNAAVIARMATADENDRTPLRIRIWRRSIVGAELGGSWRWADGDPPGDAIPAIFLSVSFALLLLTVRLRVHRRERSALAPVRRRLIIDDVGPAASAAGSVVLLAYGFLPGAILAVAAVVWLAVSARQSTQRRRQALMTPVHSH